MSTNSNIGKKKYFAYVTAPEHVTAELIKLNGIEFNSKCIIVEEAKNKPTAVSEANVLRPTSPVFGNHLTDENESKLPIGSAKKGYSETLHLSQNSSNTLIFTDSIAKGIHMYEFNRFIKNSKSKNVQFSRRIILPNAPLFRCTPPSQHFNVGSTLFQRCDQRWNNVDPTLKMKQNPTSDFQRCTTLIQRQCPTLKQRRNNVTQRQNNVAQR